MVLFKYVGADGKIIEQERKTMCRYCLGGCVSAGEIERFYTEKMREQRNAEEELLQNPRALKRLQAAMALEQAAKKRGVGRPRKVKLYRPGRPKKNTARST